MQWRFVLFAVGILLGLGLITGGCVMCWQSDKHNTCYDWKYQSPYYPLYDCKPVSTDFIAMSKCNAPCYCMYLYNYTCLDDTPHIVSPSFIGWGIAMIIAGLILLVVIIVLMKVFKLCCCC
ncbi:hypothetical protein Klosneuvirus_3_208 [Klosneuvirus KNV1]|uniref:Uncharacterized protein n=1 Tax=Klosneuvirus KNV1 TaxID=1977640 RepID=A0A1V0SK37_9VIRU|nr:hypothetical protein Klosneuvirus_3_208 [Klosneuvirus KNV1]